MANGGKQRHTFVNMLTVLSIWVLQVAGNFLTSFLNKGARITFVQKATTIIVGWVAGRTSKNHNKQ